jgi:hypothetical protein
MRPTVFSADVLRRFLRKNRIATLPQLKQLLGTEADITVFRKLKELSYRTSYSHRGSFYTLDETALFDERGLWSYDAVWFSRHGTLVATAEEYVTQSRAGCFSSELEEVLHVPIPEPGSNSCGRGSRCRTRPPRRRALSPAAFPANSGRRSFCLPACSTNNSGACTPVSNRFNWAAIARSQSFSVWIHRRSRRDDGRYWPRR